MAYNNLLAERVETLLKSKKGFSKKGMFGSIGYLLHGNLCIAVRKTDILIRVDPMQSDTFLKKKGTRLMQMRGKNLKGWLLVKEESLKGELLNTWFETSVAFVKTLPKK